MKFVHPFLCRLVLNRDGAIFVVDYQRRHVNIRRRHNLRYKEVLKFYQYRAILIEHLEWRRDRQRRRQLAA